MKSVLAFLVFMVIWIAGCFLQDGVFMIESTAYLMLYGYLVGTLGITVLEVIKDA